MILRSTLVVLLLQVKVSDSVIWEKIRCASDSDPAVPEGTTADIGRFPWLGIVQHTFYVGGKTHFAVTAGVLIHPAYAISPAEDVARIPRGQLENNTKLILWRSSSIKYALEVTDYALHPEYEERATLATIALLELYTTGETGIGENADTGELQKEVFKMSYVDDANCDRFYSEHGLLYQKMMPAISLCAARERESAPCVWDGGVALVTQQAWAFWRLTGFGVRGPGCGAPARFLNIIDYMPWINDMLTQRPDERTDYVHRLGFRRLSPISVVLYRADKRPRKEQGQCERHERKNVIYKESFEVLMSRSFGQGFFYLVVTQLAQFTCAIVNLDETSASSNAAVWLEHYCHREILGLAHGQDKPIDYTKQECFLYFKSAAFLHFRFQFSFKAVVEATLFGESEIPRRIPSPFKKFETTDDWYPTNTQMSWAVWYTFTLWYWHH